MGIGVIGLLILMMIVAHEIMYRISIRKEANDELRRADRAFKAAMDRMKKTNNDNNNKGNENV